MPFRLRAKPRERVASPYARRRTRAEGPLPSIRAVIDLRVSVAPADTRGGLPDITSPGSPDVTPDSEPPGGRSNRVEDAVTGLRNQLAEATNRAETAEHRAEAADADRREAVALAQKSVAIVRCWRSQAFA